MPDSTGLKPENAATLRRYYDKVNQGDFLGVAETLAPEAVFTIAGDTGLLPFAGAWSGRDRVVELLRAFEAAFWVVDMTEVRTLSQPNTAVSFNDEAFKVKTTGQYYRVGVVHRVEFGDDGLIRSLTNVHDTYPAVQAFGGEPAIVEAMPLPDPLPGEEEHDGAAAKAVAEALVAGIRSGDDVSGLFDDRAIVFVPGDQDVLPIAGAWVEREEISELLSRSRQFFSDRQSTTALTAAQAGSVGIQTEESATLPDGRRAIFDQYLLAQVGASGKIGRLTYYLDTYPLAGRANSDLAKGAAR